MLTADSLLVVLLLLQATAATSSDCSQETLFQCVRSLHQFSDFNAHTLFEKDELELVCPNMSSSLMCIERYTARCMSEEQRQHFESLFTGFPSVFQDLCRQGPQQAEYLSHAPCMRKVSKEFESCAQMHRQRISDMQHTGEDQIRKVCCSFQEYLECSSSAVRQLCGEGAAQFALSFLETVSSPVQMRHCDGYPLGSCTTQVADSLRAAATLPVPPLPPLLFLLVLVAQFLH